jgi:cellulose synthase/poly-beta-1,6-N-acetylglucosamine synthase-like glycosyltransferase
MTGLAVFHWVAGGTLTGLAVHASLNHLLGQRLDRMPEAPPPPPRITVLIPARNEAGRIGRCVEHWAAQEYPDFEVFVYDDDSSDDTALRAEAAAAGRARVRVIRGGPLLSGWRGKPCACHRLRGWARGEVLVFADADVRPGPQALARTAGAFHALPVDVISAVPAHRSSSVAVRALVAIQNWAALAFVPAWLPARWGRPAWTAVNGQFLAVRAEAYDQSGGFAAVREALAEDVALGRRLAALGYRVGFLDGARVIGCEPYQRARECWRANTRNLLAIFFGSSVGLGLALVALAVLYLGPPLLLAVAVLRRSGGAAWTGLPLVELGLGLLPRALADRRAGYPAWLTLLHPLAVAALVGMGVESLARVRWRRTVEWRGRRYPVTTRGR